MDQKQRCGLGGRALKTYLHRHTVKRFSQSYSMRVQYFMASGTPMARPFDRLMK